MPTLLIEAQMHVFVAKEEIDFNKVYSDLIKPALIYEGYEVFRADEEQAAGNIRTDMFQELLLADLAIADLSIDNPNVWYELGVRHALRARGVILIKSKRDYMPFDIYTPHPVHYFNAIGYGSILSVFLIFCYQKQSQIQ